MPTKNNLTVFLIDTISKKESPDYFIYYRPVTHAIWTKLRVKKKHET